MGNVKKIAAGVDLGGTNTVFGLVDREGNLLAEGCVSTRAYPEAERFTEAVCQGIDGLMKKLGAGYELAGVGIGAPNANYFTGMIDHAANLPWKGIVPLADLVRHHFPGLPVILTNDAKAAAVGEMAYGGARGMKDFILITLGTGLGSGFMSGGRIIYGYDSYAGEFGHSIVVPGGRQCGCGLRGCLETYASASGIKRTAFEVMADSNAPSELRDIPFNQLTAKMITESAQRGDQLAIETYERTGKMLGEALATAVTVTSPEAIFLFGGLARAGGFIFTPVKRHLESSLLANYRDRIRVLPSQLMDKNAAVLGASSLVWQETETK